MTRRPLFPGLDALDEAEVDLTIAKARLAGTFDDIKRRLTPTNLLDEAISSAKTKSADLAESAGEVIRDRPAAAAAGVTGVVLLIARRPIVRLIRKLFSRK
jgi:hypothetical protein